MIFSTSNKQVCNVTAVCTRIVFDSCFLSMLAKGKKWVQELNLREITK